MLSIYKLAKLPGKTRLRKISLLIQGMERDIGLRVNPDIRYLREVCSAALQQGWLPENLRSVFEDVAAACHDSGSLYSGSADAVSSHGLLDPDRLLRLLNRARHGLLSHLGTEPAEWDFFYTHSPSIISRSSDRAIGMSDERTGRGVFPISVYLDDIRSPFNVGSIFRTAEAFGAEKIMLSPLAASPSHIRAERSAMGCTAILPWERADIASLERERNLFALEQGGTALEDFHFPHTGTVIVGSEELGVSPEALKLADARLGRVSIPLYGRKASLNVSIAFGILIQVWTGKIGSIKTRAH